MIVMLGMMNAMLMRLPWVLVEHEGLDRDRYRIRRQPDAAEINVVEIPQHHPIDHQHLGSNQQFVAQDRAERLGDIAVEHQIKRSAARDSLRKTTSNTV